MTFEQESTATTTADPSAVWALWRDVGSWHLWDPAVREVAMEGHFAEGAAGTIILDGGVRAPFTLEVVEPRRRFLDRVTMGEVVMSVDHEVRPCDEGSLITFFTAVNGPGADFVGPQVTQGTPAALQALVQLAEESSR